MNSNTNNSKFKGIWISKEIWEMEDLNLIERNFLGVIQSFSKDNQRCTASNAYFAKLFKISKQRASVIINDLSRKKKIVTHIKRDRESQQVIERVCVPLNIGFLKKKQEIEKTIEKKDINYLQVEFKKSLIPFLSKYGEKTVDDFYQYWSEPNPSNTKLRLQLEKTWDTNRRLSRWKSNEIKYIKKTPNHILHPKDEKRKQNILNNAKF